MKKLLFTALFSALFIGSAFAQIRFQTDLVIGQKLQAVNTLNKDTFTLHFNTSKAISSWAPAKTTANLGKDSISFQKAQTQKGIQVKAFINNVLTTAYEDGSLKCNNAGGNGNPGHFSSMASLQEILVKSIGTVAFPAVNGHLNDSLTRPAACLFDVGAGDQAFGMYPGKATKIEYIYRFDFSSKACTDEITFDINTYDVGTSGKTATYELAVYKSSTFSEANLLGSKVTNFYTTGQGLKTAHVAAEIGLTPSDLSNKSLYIVVKTLGTNNDGLRYEVDVNNLPIAVDPTIVFDNFFMTYATASWAVPVGAVASTVFNHNNGSPINLGTGSTDFTGGTPVPVYINTDTPVSFYLTDINRVGALDITEGNDGGGHIAKFSFAATGAVMKKALDGTFSIPVAYTYTPSDGTTKMDLLIAAPTLGFVNDTLKVTLTASNVASGMTPAVRLEITNGVRFWYNVGVIGELTTAVETANAQSVSIFSANNSVFATNATENVLIFNVTGQKLKTLTPAQAAQGVVMQQGLYIVKSGTSLQKVLVK